MVALKWGVISVTSLSGIALGTYKLSNWAQPTDLIQQARGVLPPPQEKSVPLGSQISNLSSELVTQDQANDSNLSPEEKERRRIKKEADSAFSKLDDYTFKLFSSCNVGTGWILDYVLPKEKGKYPLIWYIATNAHVVNHWLFDNSNPYSQKLPIAPNKSKHQSYYNWYSSKFPLHSSQSCYFKKTQGTFDLNLSKQPDGEALKSDWGAVNYLKKMKQPKLFWVAVDLFDIDLNMGVLDKNFKDFAVMEIEFNDEDSAREITRGFADKYTVESTEAINIFGKPLDIHNLESNNQNFYSLGYPSKASSRFSYVKGWDEETLSGEKLSTDPRNRYPIISGNKLKGHVASDWYKNPEWAGENHHNFGHFYLLEGFPLGKGASGSMSIDGKGNLIGLKTKGEEGVQGNYSMITPIRSEKLIIEGNFRTPKYDLILGAEKQKSSYREQVEQHILEKGNKTWLSERGWKHVS
ncbi:hypothetical protein DNK47_03110 [Mycoplasma wenyonii]|uniref:DUF31 domain-containing protein n=1 Tax=Mycoplasma wenyonii TaxID=65123 RepID=A0A328PIA8_9MOLU|nr:hypothetical protein [Mycoplasma wenyonii]RAO94803.1 hypothetical protein DNK47_03110 [Mycoplasma wenyonii]